jgi:NIMA (never in mitosis gene a)-related kinase 1/4/5
MIGTPYYLSPEMVEGKPYSTKADVWALGVVLYQLCSYKLPFEANSLPVLALKILKGAFPPLPNQYSKDLKALLLQMLCTDQKRRPSVEAILTKPFLNKYLPQEEKAKLVMKQEQRQEAKKEREKKIEKVEKAEKVEDKDGKEKAKREKE